MGDEANCVRLCRATIWIGDPDRPGRRVSVLTKNLKETREKLEAAHGEGNVFDLHNEEAPRNDASGEPLSGSTRNQCDLVMPEVVACIQPTARADACGELDSGDERRNDIARSVGCTATRKAYLYG